MSEMDRKEPDAFSFCETIHAMGPWHIRRLSERGKKFSGGADTETLCGLRAAWDINCEISDASLNGNGDRVGRSCPSCKGKYLEAVA